MNDTKRLQEIRESERRSHISVYSDTKLYSEGSWLRKPIKTVMEILPCFAGQSNLRILDLGCGVGRNSISVAQHSKNSSCIIDCVDILELAIQKLMEYAEEYHVSDHIRGIVRSIDDFSIPENHYDWIMAISSLEHVDSRESFVKKLYEIRNGIRKNGIVCLVINSDISEYNKQTNQDVPPQFEVNLPAEEIQKILHKIFIDWDILKNTHREQRYDIPRESGIHVLHTTVVTYVARKV